MKLRLPTNAASQMLEDWKATREKEKMLKNKTNDIVGMFLEKIQKRKYFKVNLTLVNNILFRSMKE
jgi:hypothetical protein